MTMLQAWIVAQIASFRDGWVFRKRLAVWARCSVRTVQRAITKARSLGLLGVARAKANEVPPGASHAFACGWSHRWTIGWGKAAAQVRRMVVAARLAWMTRRTVAKAVASGNVEATAPPPRRWTAAELDAELERLTRA
jgi:hypothetical protein